MSSVINIYFLVWAKICYCWNLLIYKGYCTFFINFKSDRPREWVRWNISIRKLQVLSCKKPIFGDKPREDTFQIQYLQTTVGFYFLMV